MPQPAIRVILVTKSSNKKSVDVQGRFAQREDYRIIRRSTSFDTLLMLSYHTIPNGGYCSSQQIMSPSHNLEIIRYD